LSCRDARASRFVPTLSVGAAFFCGRLATREEFVLNLRIFHSSKEAARQVIERHGRAVAVVLSKEEYDELNDIKLQQLRAEINLGLADLQRGAYTDYEANELPKLAERIKAAGRKQLARK
jgi:hypothetical protein